MANEFDLDGSIVPWGRNADEYEAFFDLVDVPASARILDCGSGPSSFCAESWRAGRSVVAVDPVYARPVRDILDGFDRTAVRMLEGMRRAYERFDWTSYGSPEAVVDRRRAALDGFVAHVSEHPGSYVAASLPRLPFLRDSFDLVLCSHLLFLYSEELGLAAHVQYLEELLRVGREVRVYPLLDMSGEVSPHLEACAAELERAAHVEIAPVPYEFRLGDSNMLKVTRRPGGR